LDKKLWTKPTLIVLVRSEPEEAILNNCKGSSHSGPLAEDGNCVGDANGRCNACSAVAAS